MACLHVLHLGAGLLGDDEEKLLIDICYKHLHGAKVYSWTTVPTRWPNNFCRRFVLSYNILVSLVDNITNVTYPFFCNSTTRDIFNSR